MPTIKQNKTPSNVAADAISTESLSFTALVCVQEQSTDKRDHRRHATKHMNEPEFEFSITTQQSSHKDQAPINIASRGWVNPKGQVRPDAIASYPGKIHGISKSTNPLQRSGINRLEANENGEIPEKLGSLLNHEATGRGNKKPPKGGFRSFVAPCRLCRVQEPELLVKEQVHNGGKIQ